MTASARARPRAVELPLPAPNPAAESLPFTAPTTSRGRNARRPRPACRQRMPAACDGRFRCSRSAPQSRAMRSQRACRRHPARLRLPAIQSSGSRVHSSDALPSAPHSGCCARLGAGPQHGQQANDALCAQRARQIDTVAPDAAHRIERHQHAPRRGQRARIPPPVPQAAPAARPGCR